MFKKVILFIVFFVLFSFVGTSNVEAIGMSCTGWDCKFVVVDPVTGDSTQFCTGLPSGCDDANQYCIDHPLALSCEGLNEGTNFCPAGKYVCNRGCCDMSGGGSSNGGGSCTTRTDNCPDGWTPSPNRLTTDVYPHATNPYCSRRTYCGPMGSAQIVTGCCSYDYTDPEVPCLVSEVKSVECCPPNTEESYTDSEGSLYTRDVKCPWPCNPTVCNNALDTYIGNVPYNCRNVEREFEPDVFDYICDYTTTCRQNIRSYYCKQLCAPAVPENPTLSTPANLTEVYVNTPVTLTWNPVADWGTSCTTSNNQYFLCVGYEDVNCKYVGTWNGVSTSYQWTPSVVDPLVEWAVAANNGDLESGSTKKSVCVEALNPTVSQWSATCTDHKRSRTCTETCGTNDCTAYFANPANCSGSACSTSVVNGVLTQTQDCLAEIRGTLFDATDITGTVCPFAYDINTGYFAVGTTPVISNKTFGIIDQNAYTPPWAPLTPTTDLHGKYSFSAYAPSTYSFDFSSLNDTYIVSSGPKIVCGDGVSAIADVSGSDSSCVTQPCTVRNLSFGFNRFFGGWWQVKGGNVHAEGGIKSEIPSAYEDEKSLILRDINGRSGVLSYGTFVTQMLGSENNAEVSANHWQVESNYEGTIYDYDFFALQFKKYPSTVWNGIGGFTYVDNGSGFEIVKVSGDLSNFNYSPAGIEKVIFLVDGDVTISAANITVPVGAYMSVIASGDINFASTVAKAEGWYLADNINIPCADANSDTQCDKTDIQFLGNGSFVAWKGINLSRDLGDVPITNIDMPSEKFTYRTDLYTNAPEAMKIISKRYKPFVP